MEKPEITRPQALTYRTIDGADQFIVTDFLAGCQAVHREADVYGVVLIAAGGSSMVLQEPMTEQQANALVEYVRSALKAEALMRGTSINLNKLLAKIKDALPDNQLIVADSNVVQIHR